MRVTASLLVLLVLVEIILVELESLSAPGLYLPVEYRDRTTPVRPERGAIRVLMSVTVQNCPVQLPAYMQTLESIERQSSQKATCSRLFRTPSAGWKTRHNGGAST